MYLLWLQLNIVYFQGIQVNRIISIIQIPKQESNDQMTVMIFGTMTYLQQL
jgi:hypothetical protein